MHVSRAASLRPPVAVTSLGAQAVVEASLRQALDPSVASAVIEALAKPVRTGLRDGTQVDVYYNLHENILSLRHNGIVEAHAPNAFVRDVRFVVNEGGRQRVIEEGRKNVHAFVRGKTRTNPPFAELALLTPVAVTYNPYKYDSFVERTSKRPVSDTKYAAVVDKVIIAWVPAAQ